MTVDADIVAKDYTEALLSQCEQIESQLTASGLDAKFSRLLSIQAAYNSMKQLLVELDDVKTQEEIFKVMEFDIKQIVFNIKPNVLSVGHA